MNVDDFDKQLRGIEKKYSIPGIDRSAVDQELVALVCTGVHPCDEKSTEERLFLEGICQLAARDQSKATLEAIEKFGDPKAANFALSCACGLRHHAVSTVRILVEAGAILPDALENALKRMIAADRRDVVPILAKGLKEIKASPTPTKFWDLHRLLKPREIAPSNTVIAPR